MKPQPDIDESINKCAVCGHPETHHEPKCFGLGKITRDYCRCEAFQTQPEEAATPIKTPVKYVAEETLFYDGNGKIFCTLLVPAYAEKAHLERIDAVGQYIAKVLNEYPTAIKERERLHKELVAANKGAQTNARVNQIQAGKLNALTAERDAYKAALEQIRAEGYWSAKFNSQETLVQILDEHQDLARQALSSKESK